MGDAKRKERPTLRRWQVEFYRRGSDGLWFVWVYPVADCSQAYAHKAAAMRNARRMVRNWLAGQRARVTP